MTEEPGDSSAKSGRERGREHIRAAKSELESQVAHARDQVAHAREQFDHANEKIIQRTGRNLIVAILIGVGIGAVVLLTLLFAPLAFAILAIGVAGLGVFELVRALHAGGRRLDVVPQVAGAVAIVAVGWFAGVDLLWLTVFLVACVVVVWRSVAQMIARDGRLYRDVLSDMTVSVFVQLYVPFLVSLALVLLRGPDGAQWVLSFIAIAVAADTGAYVTGLTLGKHPMAPKISPKKTWEGFAGAAAASILAGVLLGYFLIGIPLWAGAIFGIVILGTATLGDLAESMLKRDLGIKDMSSWLPGHGGVLDRLDSMLPSALGAFAIAQLFTLFGVV